MTSGQSFTMQSHLFVSIMSPFVASPCFGFDFYVWNDALQTVATIIWIRYFHSCPHTLFFREDTNHNVIITGDTHTFSFRGFSPMLLLALVGEGGRASATWCLDENIFVIWHSALREILFMLRARGLYAHIVIFCHIYNLFLSLCFGCFSYFPIVQCS